MSIPAGISGRPNTFSSLPFRQSFFDGIVATSASLFRASDLNASAKPLDLTELDHLPAGLLERPASALYQQLEGPTLIHLRQSYNTATKSPAGRPSADCSRAITSTTSYPAHW
jgi:hypothetical protein